MARPYFTLLWWMSDKGWTIQFGDYDRELVEAERDDFKSHGTKGKHLKIIRTPSARQAEIDAAVAKLNEVVE